MVFFLLFAVFSDFWRIFSRQYRKKYKLSHWEFVIQNEAFRLKNALLKNRFNRFNIRNEILLYVLFLGIILHAYMFWGTIFGSYLEKY